MNIDYLIQLLSNRLATLNLSKDQAFQVGDLERINIVLAEMSDVDATITKLKMMQSLEQTALATSTSFTDVVKNAVEATFVPTVVNGSTEVLLKYDITPYATDPYHETKIQTILENMGVMDTPDQIDTYLKKSTPDTPLTGMMIYNSASSYNVDSRLLMALMELDSRYGTQGLGARTFNPGNVGNNGIDERTYPSWEAGVNAVANWLNNHRIKTQQTEPVAPVVNPVLDFTTVPAAAPVQTIETIVITPDTASGITSVATSTAPVATTTEPVAEPVVATSTAPVEPVSATTTEPVIATSTESN
jgi:hypothetical protein